MICWDVEQPTEPCPYAHHCNPMRQAVQVSGHQLGMECVFFQGFVQAEAYHVGDDPVNGEPPKEAA